MTSPAEKSYREAMALLGQPIDDNVITGLRATKVPRTPDQITREAEMVLRSLEIPATIRMVECKECKEKFATNYAGEHYCSHDCRARAFLKLYGIEWDWEKTDYERYFPTVPPSTISPGAVKRLIEWADHLRGHQAESPKPPTDLLTPEPAQYQDSPITFEFL